MENQGVYKTIQTDGQIDKLDGQMDGWIDGWMNRYRLTTMSLKSIGWASEDWINAVQNTEFGGSCESGNESSNSITPAIF